VGAGLYSGCRAINLEVMAGTPGVCDEVRRGGNSGKRRGGGCSGLGRGYYYGVYVSKRRGGGSRPTDSLLVTATTS
jgi:hypothetical protein